MLDKNSVWVLQIMAWAICGIAGMTAAWFQFRESGQTSQEKQSTQDWYRNRWEKIQDTGIFNISESVIHDLLKWKNSLSLRVRDKLEWMDGWPCAVAIAAMLVINVIGFPSNLNSWFFLFYIYMWVAGIYLFFQRHEDPMPFFAILTEIITLRFCMSMDILSATVLMIGLLPLHLYLTVVTIIGFEHTLFSFRSRELLGDNFFNNGLLFGISVWFSFGVTFIAMTIGHFAENASWVPRTYQMLISNFFFDGLTMLATFRVLEAAVGPNRRYPIPIAIVLDLIVAAILSCMALWFGLVGTAQALSTAQLLKVLIGMNPGGEGFSIGPFFWIMHTTFIPTFIFLFILSVCWFGKWAVLPIMGVLERGHQIENPHHHTAMAFALLAAIFGVMAAALGWLSGKSLPSSSL
ncbi:hypothetical protein ACTRXD_15595 [Nitrospira sp. T9]|uniref:hypothetical protein n=1 Tax=unclassified Nitrospira TaxID=2652172 RepID=UPI003F985B02